MNLIIVGGGTAGWLTALYLNRIAPDYNIILIESEEISILGAGEGSVPVFPYFLYNLGISEEEIIKETNATFKSGISFENWKGIGDKYMHGFAVEEPMLDFDKIVKSGSVLNVGLSSNATHYTITNLIANDKKLDNSLITHLLSYGNKSPYLSEGKEFKKVINYSYHFDAKLMALFLRKKAEQRSVKRIEGKVEEIISNEDGSIKGIKVNNQIYDSDFVFDCTGFNRLIIGKHFNTEWVSYKDQLKINTAIPFFLPQETDHIKPYTQAIAMKYGWMWKIPLQDRYGCGYNFDSNYTSVDEAKKEVEEYLNQEIKINKVIEFEAGRYKNVWVKNCIALGLSAGFTEPIEATSIWTVMTQLYNLTKLNISNTTHHFKDEYNDYIGGFNDSILNFLYYHYLTERNDTDFWKDYQSTTITPKSLDKKLKIWKHRTPNIFDQDKIVTFPNISYIEVGLGTNDNLIPLEVFKKENQIYKLDEDFQSWMNTYNYNIKQAMNTSIDNKVIIELIKSL